MELIWLKTFVLLVLMFMFMGFRLMAFLWQSRMQVRHLLQEKLSYSFLWRLTANSQFFTQCPHPAQRSCETTGCRVKFGFARKPWTISGFPDIFVRPVFPISKSIIHRQPDRIQEPGIIDGPACRVVRPHSSFCKWTHRDAVGAFGTVFHPESQAFFQVVVPL